MFHVKNKIPKINTRDMLTFTAICLFYLFETGQMSYYSILAPAYLSHAYYNHANIGAISAAYYYGVVAGLFPVGYALDRFSLRVSLIFALGGSILGAFILLMSDSFSMQWISRFICGFCGGTFSFIGGIRIISIIFKERFTYWFSIFLGAGILGAMLFQYPLLVVVNHFGPKGAMFAVCFIGALIAIFNYFYLHPPTQVSTETQVSTYAGGIWQMCRDIIFNWRNFFDVLMIVLLETPGTILGTLWGVVFIMDFFHLQSIASSVVVTAMLLGSIIGLPVLGDIAERCKNKPWIITSCSIICVFLVLLMFYYHDSQNLWLIASLFFGLGFFYSCQTVGFHWITKNMKPELIGRNSAFNSMIFMSTNGGLKQLSAYLLAIPAIFFTNAGAAGNLLTIILFSMLMVIFYLCVRKFLLKKQLI